MIRIGITGGIGSGKSTVAGILAKMGFPVLSADTFAHAAMEKGHEAYYQIINVFGAGILGPDSQIDRRALGAIVFGDNASRNRLEKIIHPIVIADIQKEMHHLATDGTKVVFVEVPLLFEAGMETMFDEVWVVSVSLDAQVERLKERDRLSGEEIRRRVSAQMPLKEKETRANRIIFNNAGKSNLEKQLRELLQALELI